LAYGSIILKYNIRLFDVKVISQLSKRNFEIYKEGL